MAKIAITGHSAGIGKALAEIYENQGHEVVGLSRRNGYNIKNVNKLADKIELCDVFINNAQADFAQTELLFIMYKKWKSIPNKKIINISTAMTSLPVSNIPGIDMIAYYVQKKTLEQAIIQLRHLQDWPKLFLIKPGAVATQPGQVTPRPYADVNVWAQKIVDIIEVGPDLEVLELTLGVNYE